MITRRDSLLISVTIMLALLVPVIFSFLRHPQQITTKSFRAFIGTRRATLKHAAPKKGSYAEEPTGAGRGDIQKDA